MADIDIDKLPEDWKAAAQRAEQRKAATPPEQRRERDALDKKGLFLEPVRTDEEKTKMFAELAKMEEAKAKQEASKTEREKLKRGVVIPPQADPSAIVLELAMASDTATVKLEYLFDPFLPRRCVVCFAGRGGTAKTSFLATIAAGISNVASTLWVSVEEPADWIRVRHIRCGGIEKTLAVVIAVASKKDQHDRIIGSSFNIYDHLEPSIVKAKQTFDQADSATRPLRLVVLDTAVGLTAWAKNESPNDDAAVKRLLGHLQGLAEKHDLTIAFIQHANKGKHDHFADTVAGASAWTNSPRLSFVHASDRRTEHAYVMRVAKSNLTQPFGTAYTTTPVHTLYERADGKDSVLCQVDGVEVVWGNTASMEMFEEATRKPSQDEGEEFKGLPSIVENAIQKLVEMVMATTPGQAVTREDVQRELGRPIGRREWTKIDNHMHGYPTVFLEHGPSNRALYKRRT